MQQTSSQQPQEQLQQQQQQNQQQQQQSQQQQMQQVLTMTVCPTYVFHVLFLVVNSQVVFSPRASTATLLSTNSNLL